MGAFSYPTFAVCVVIYNVLAALGSLLYGWLSPLLLEEHSSTDDARRAHYSLIIEDQKYDPLMRFPGARLQIDVRDTSRKYPQEIQLSIKEKKKHVAS